MHENYQPYIEVFHFAKKYPTFTKIYKPTGNGSYFKQNPQLDHIKRIFEFDQKDDIINHRTDPKMSEDTILSSISRTKVTITDLILCNQFDMFITFTFDPNKVDRTNPDKVKKVMTNWLKEQQKRNNSNIKYLLVPEFHKDGKAIHFHGLFKDYTGNIQPARSPSTQRYIFQNGKQVYNLLSFQSGYTNLTYIKDLHATGLYVKKYITKDMPLFGNKKRYWASHNLVKPTKHYNPDLRAFDNIEPIDSYKNQYFKIDTYRDTITT